MQFPVSETCPKCRKLVAIATVELHPTHPDRAGLQFHVRELRTREDADCVAPHGSAATRTRDRRGWR
jgi:hypothetical protein